MFGFRSATGTRRRPRHRRARREQQHRRSYATPVTSPPLPVPRPGSRAAGSPPRAGRTFLDAMTEPKAECEPMADAPLIEFKEYSLAATVLADVNRGATVKIPMRRQR